MFYYVVEGGAVLMTREEELYSVVCETCSVEALTDEDLQRIESFFQSCLDNLSQPPHLLNGEIVDIDSNVS